MSARHLRVVECPRQANLHPLAAERRFGINPEPLRTTGRRVIADPDAGRCEALIHGPGPEDEQPQCLRDARWIVTTNGRIEVRYCSQHLHSRGYAAGDANVRAA